MTAPVTMDSIRRFLNVQRLVIAGLSRNRQDYSRSVAKELILRGHEVIGLNPSANALDGLACFSAVEQIQPAPEAVILLVPENQILDTTRQCLAAGVRHLWFRRSAKSSEDYSRAIAEASAAGANVISGECPLMFLPDTAWIHRAHGFLRQVTGSYPA